VRPDTGGRAPPPLLLRWPAIVAIAAVALSWRAVGGDVGLLVSADARSAFLDFARGFWPPAHGREFLTLLGRPLAETVAIAFLGMTVALAVGVPLAFLAADPRLTAAGDEPVPAARRLAWAVSRGALDLMRSIPELVWALVFVRAVGLGAAAGILAIGIGYGGVVGKVFAEIFESGPRGPARALAGAGASPGGAFLLGVLPPSVPMLTSYALYRFDCALRTSAVLGLVGAGGIGLQLELSMKMFAWDEVAAMVLALFAVVGAVDALSRRLRRRIHASRGLLPSGPGARAAVRAAVPVSWAALAAGAAWLLGLPLGDLFSWRTVRGAAAFAASTWPPDLSPAFLREVASASLETLAVSVLGTAIALALGLPLAAVAAHQAHVAGPLEPGASALRRLPVEAASTLARAILAFGRTLPEILWALLLVFAVGLGPFAGALALGLHSAGVLGRLHAEALEEVPPGPVAALRASGASGLAAAAFGAWPQAVPQIVAYTLYRWEVAIRACAVLGVVGAGGIGKQLHVALSLFHHHRTLTLVAAVVALVTSVDLFSGWLRSHLPRNRRSNAMNVPTRFVAAAVLLVALAAPVRAQETLRVSAIPDEAPTELQRKFAPLGAYLEKALGMKVVFTPVSDYAATVEGLAAGTLDLVWYGGFTFVQARRRTGTAIPLVQRAEDAHFHSKFIVPATSKAKTLADLKGASFAFGSVSSTSGHLMPRYFLIQNGIDPDRDLGKIAFSGAHDATAKWVEAGKVDAGVLNESVLQKMLDEKKLDPARIRVLWTTPDYPDYNWTVRGDLDPKVREKLRAAFLALDPANPEHKAILDLQRASRFIPTAPENYAPIEAAARSAKLIQD